MIPGRCSRMLRAAVFAAVCVLLAALGHVMMSGELLSWWAPVVGFAVTGGAGWGLTGRERGVPLVTGVALVAQAVLHFAFSLAPTATTGTMRGMDHMGAAGGTLSRGMLAGHLLAALLCGLWLAYGERAGFRVLRAVAGWLTAPLRWPSERPVPARPPRARVCDRSERVPRPFLLVDAITSRGPPARTAVA
ncbi:hypothetical protein [Streptomyces sp. NPDC096132]|uniref:hypothetical protein n=1 Tax=Streptomyces sp. NPDC096132 TaxID=3366075 RepID=UPI003820E4A2